MAGTRPDQLLVWIIGQPTILPPPPPPPQDISSFTGNRSQGSFFFFFFSKFHSYLPKTFSNQVPQLSETMSVPTESL